MFSSGNKRKLVNEMSAGDARDFFLKSKSYFNISLPPYFNFYPLLNDVRKKLEEEEKPKYIFDIVNKFAAKTDGVNYVLLINKDSHYAWRPLELIHPVIYVSLTIHITKECNWSTLKKRFQDFHSSTDKILCASLPGESTEEKNSDIAATISGWWQEVEQASLAKSLDFKYLFVTDISNYYPSIYTHSISWAIHTKEKAKEKEYRVKNAKEKYLGPAIDYFIQAMSYGQTNGIPQGSVLMDFISEIILGYADEQLTLELSKQKIVDYYIIRYRDDYRIFTNSKNDSEKISRALILVLQELGLHLNASKSIYSEDIILDSIKKDKRDALVLLKKKLNQDTIKDSLLKLIIFSRENPNSGQLNKQIQELDKKLKKKLIDEKPEKNDNFLKDFKDIEIIISMITDIMLNNPKTIPHCALLLSKTLCFTEDDEKKKDIIKRIRKKFEISVVNSFLDIWLQRISYPIEKDMEYKERLCGVVSGKEEIKIWASDCVKEEIQSAMKTSFIDKKELHSLSYWIDEKEVALFYNY